MSTNSNGAEPTAEKTLPNSKKIYVAGKIHPDVRVPFREISLAPTKTISGEIEVNEPVRVYDTSGPWGDNASPARTVDVAKGLSPLRAKWIRDRGDVEEISGRKVQPIDDGYLSAKHAATARPARTENGNGSASFNRADRKIIRAKNGAVTQLAYARRGIITPEL
jgi:phosphomethylpyrimidine synthase